MLLHQRHNWWNVVSGVTLQHHAHHFSNKTNRELCFLFHVIKSVKLHFIPPLCSRQHVYYTFWTKRKSSEIFILTSKKYFCLLQTQIKASGCVEAYTVCMSERDLKDRKLKARPLHVPRGPQILKGKIQKHSSDSRVKVWPARGASWSSAPVPLNRKRCFLTGNTRLNMQRRQVICSELQLRFRPLWLWPFRIDWRTIYYRKTKRNGGKMGHRSDNQHWYPALFQLKQSVFFLSGC